MKNYPKLIRRSWLVAFLLFATQLNYVFADDPPGCGHWEAREFVTGQGWIDQQTGKWVEMVVGWHWEYQYFDVMVWIEWAAGDGEWQPAVAEVQVFVEDKVTEWVEDYAWGDITEIRDVWVEDPGPC